MDYTKTITHLSLCSGYEGIGTGLRRVLPSLREIAYVEIEAFAIANLVSKMEAGEMDAAPVFTDVKTFPYGKFRGCVDILSGGFPCQPFSNAGVRKGTEDPRHLFPYIRDGIRECRPGIVFLENVEGIISSKTSDGESVLQYVLRELEGLGYIATAGVFSASEVSAPHQRKRVFILAIANSFARGIHTEGWNDGAEARPAGKKLADDNTQRVEKHSVSESVQEEHSTAGDCGLDHWPARPGQPQYEWEEPRVIESELGRTTNGASSRVDRLRLLGNGVVPATAAKAFVTLIQRVI